MKKSTLKKVIKEIADNENVNENVHLKIIQQAIRDFFKEEKVKIPLFSEKSLSFYIEDELKENGYYIIDQDQMNQFPFDPKTEQ